MVIFLIILSVILFSLVCFLSYLLYINMIKLEKLTTVVEVQTTLIGRFYLKIKETQNNIKVVDRLGAFQADDETGFIFKDIQLYIDELKDYINRYITENESNGKNK